MKIYRGLADGRIERRPRSIAIGIFDGVHRGHQEILRRAIRAARRMKIRSLAVTFDPHPAKVLRPRAQSPKILMSLEHRLGLLEREGFDEALVIRFTKAFSRHSAERFLERDLVGRLGMKRLCVGKDFRFGAQGRGDAALLGRRAPSLGYELAALGPVRQGGAVVSSTRIRAEIERGRLAEASRLLGRPVSVRGTVVRGKSRGRDLGFRTANLDPHHETLPPPGVYAAWGKVRGRRRSAAVHVGPRPTFDEAEPSLEAHFPGFSGNLYGEELELFFVRKLRPLKKFRSVRALRKAIENDLRKLKQIH